MAERNSNNIAVRGPRSPGYPAVTLDKALERARLLKDYSPGRKPIPVYTALAQWKYSPGSGAGLQLLASLKKFGLLTDSGKKDRRVVQLTDLAWNILTDPRPDSRDRLASIQKAAIEPTIHREILDRWPHGLPDDTTMYVWLVQEKAFNEGAVKGLMSQLRATFEYAKLDSELHTGNNNGDNTDPLNQPKVGDFVQWTSQGAAQFQEPKKLAGVSDDGEYAFVEGERGGIPMSQLSVETPLATAGAGSGTANPPANPFFNPAPSSDGVPLSIKTRPGSVEILTIPKMTRKAFEFLKTQLTAFEDEIVAEDDQAGSG